MIRGLWFFAQLALLVLASVWLAEQKGAVSIAWHGRLIETSVGVLILAVFIAAAFLLVVWRLWRSIRGTPRAIGRFRFQRKRNRGRVSLIQALSAIASGEGAAALRHASEAEAIGEPALAHLAAAQAAEIAGDPARAEIEYARLADRPDTALIGLRGLIGLAELRGDIKRAVELARRARKAAPKSPWVAGRLWELEVKAGDFGEAERTLAGAAKLGAVQAADADRRLAGLLLARALRAEASGRGQEALTDAERAHDLDPTLGDAAVLAARLLARSGRTPAAERILSKAWAAKSSRAIAHAWIALAPKGDVTQRLRQAERLHAFDRDNGHGRLALAEVEMAGGRWAEARGHLAAVARPDDPAFCHLMAYLECASGNETAARGWLERSFSAGAAETWPALTSAA
jgi:HemY protein